ncbi:Ig-like domain-containing protein, partial [Confluentibacter sediminis]|uniref:Ig-like domain-containing protein n=1 Tax=Confluentibacter sediminis TaxID=2219045 RepID=UPI001C734905
MNKLYYFLIVIFSSILLQNLQAQTVDMEVRQGPNIDVVLTVGVTDQNIDDFETDLGAALESKGIPKSKLYVQGFERSTISSNSEDAAAIFNGWTRWGYHSTTWEFDDAQKFIRRINNDYLSGFYDPVFDSSNYTMEVDVASTQGNDDDDMGITFGIKNGPIGSYLFNLSGLVRTFISASDFIPGDGFASGLYKITRNDGNSTDPRHYVQGLQSAANTIFTKGATSTWYHVKLEVKGKSAKIWIDNVLIIDYTATEEIGGSYGFFSNSQPYATFKNIEVTSLTLKKFKDVLREPQWRNSAMRFNVNLDDQEVAGFNKDSDLSEILMRTINEDIHYLGWGVNDNKDQFERFVAQNNNKGTFINRDSGNWSSWIDSIAQYIYEQYQFGTISAGDYFIAGTSVEIAVTPTELKKNTANASYPNGRWKITHDETFFPNNTGKVSWNNLYLEDVPEFYEKTGKYTFSFEDMPTAPTILFFHRKPVASFTYNPGAGTLTNNSYDLDGGANNGIAQSEWKWKAVDAASTNDWTDGQFSPSGQPDGQYLIMLTVQDHQGTWSKPASVYIEKTSASGGSEDLPIAQFNIMPDVLTTYSGAMTINVQNNSSDPYGRTLSTEEWIVVKRVYDNAGNPTDTQIYNGGTPMTDFSAYNTGSADYIISLRTQTNTGVWSLPFYRTLTIIDDNSNPTITASPANGNITTEDTVQLTFEDETSGSGFDVQRYALSQSITPPATDATSWRSWSNSQSKEVSFSSGGTWYIHAEAKDQAGNVGTATFGPYSLTLILTAENDLAITQEDTASSPINVLFNDSYNAGGTVAVTIHTQGTKGTATVDGDNNIIYTPDLNKNGTDTVVYQLDNDGLNVTGTITISIQSVDDLPVAVVDSFNVDENASITEDVSTNDEEVDGDELTYYLMSGPAHAATFTFNNDGTFTYENNGDEVDTDSFTYRFEDANNFSGTVTVTLNIALQNDLPEGGNVSLEVVEDIGYSFKASDFTFTDVDAGDGFNGIQIIQIPSTGTLTYNGYPVQNNDLIDDVTKLVYTTATDGYGTDYASFSFKVKDQSNALSTDSYTMSLGALKDTDGDGLADVVDPDIDGDGTPNEQDAFPYDPTEDTDTDGDGVGNIADPDDDNDGTPDDQDAFPLDSSEDTDTDGDGVGNNADLDDDNDGTPDDQDAFPLDSSEDTDTDGDGVGNNADLDDDNDGTPDDQDAFPLDPTEDTDTDGDGVGNNADLDDDNDGTPDDQDAFPLDPTEDTDTDGDGVGNNADLDDDNDGTPDDQDTFPLDTTEDTDTDGDGMGNNADPDDDNDGTPDDQDAFPLDSSEDTDTDGDGMGNNADPDDDNDGTPDDQDAFPLDTTEDTDTDGDGMGNNADPDDDNDGTPD